MPYDYYLESDNEKKVFTEEMLLRMHEYINKISHYKVDDKFYYVFKNDSRRDVAIPLIQSKIARGKNIYSHSGIGLTPTFIHLVIIGDVDVDRYIYDFVVWCQKHFPCQLYEGSEVVPPEELLFEEEFEIPRID